ncbi:MAG TPA: phosphatase PAP2 family protein [Candidatus Polarisedimenticolia bacterium]|nr:phosphatase PAP2 family protein [Candidatus Polarisedimenticolia bacterium]
MSVDQGRLPHDGKAFRNFHLLRGGVPLLILAMTAAPCTAATQGGPRLCGPIAESAPYDEPVLGDTPADDGSASSDAALSDGSSSLDGTSEEQQAVASEDEASDKPYWRTNLFRRFFSDQKYLFTDWLPAEVHRPGFIYPVLLGTGIALAAGRDADASQPDLGFERDFSSDTGGATLSTAHVFTNLGDAPAGLFLIGTAYLAGRWSGHDRFAESASLSAEAVLDTGLWVSVLKHLTARTRPNAGGTGQFFQYNPPPGQKNDSFPSGHASGAFAAATVFAGMYREQHRWVPWVAYGTAGLVAASRVALGRHFPTDVFVGALVGNSFGRMVLSRDQPVEKRASSGLTPFYDPASGAEGVTWHREW